jgi:antitoxin (DNA-binding transcriptional repressor) of toxin-antitoxin stability system
MDRLDAAAVLGATVDELRAAGCTPAELVAAAPRETLRSLDARESTWEVAAATLLEAGYSRGEAVAHLAAHAASPIAFAAGVTTIVDDPADAFTYAANRAQPEDLAVLSEQYGLDPAETGRMLVAAGARTDTVVEVLDHRCEHDPVITAELVHIVVGDDVATFVHPHTSLMGRGVNEQANGLTPDGHEQLVETGVDW